MAGGLNLDSTFADSVGLGHVHKRSATVMLSKLLWRRRWHLSRCRGWNRCIGQTLEEAGETSVMALLLLPLLWIQRDVAGWCMYHVESIASCALIFNGRME